MLSKVVLLSVLGASVVSAQCVGPAVNDATIDLVTSFEGFEPDICTSNTNHTHQRTNSKDDDLTGNPTVGYGHLCSDSSCSDVSYSIPLSEADGRRLLQSDIAVRPETLLLIIQVANQ